ncbi:uncharacterized protein YpmB [Lactobacillus colini]|uniref:Uncharacterized protein YpmB n=1 Tax=Lactobacillus colini TaxID=1819254 RepID=A0ABS4MBM3_9LACO|nr:hypothetical protein [Lactobacillus colini]MBP2057081.1 uncharacterized protein YpmB [Lactobacillus colini]
MNQRVKQGLRTIASAIGILAAIYLICIIIFIFATNSQRQDQKAVAAVAIDKTPIIKINKTYHLSRSVKSDSVVGTDRKGHKYYFIYLSHSKKSYLYSSNSGLSEARIRSIFLSKHPGHSNLKIELGWYKARPVWEISYKKNNGNYGYALYNFKDGKEIYFIDNI